MRDAAPADGPALRALVESGVAATHTARLAALIDAGRQDDERRLLVADAAGEGVVGAVAYGMVAGAEGSGTILAIALRRAWLGLGLGRLLVEGALARLAAMGADRAFCELAERPELHRIARLLARCGFVEEGRVDDYHADGIALRILRREIADAARGSGDGAGGDADGA